MFYPNKIKKCRILMIKSRIYIKSFQVHSSTENPIDFSRKNLKKIRESEKFLLSSTNSDVVSKKNSGSGNNSRNKKEILTLSSYTFNIIICFPRRR